MNILLIIVIAVSLSMDAFSLSLAYGTLNLSNKNINHLSIIVGFYHFFMPIIGMLIGQLIFKYLPIEPDLIVFAVLVIIGIQMLIESFKREEKVKIMTFMELLLFGLAVSIDSFSVGIGLKGISNNYILAAIIFSIASFLFTYVGLNLGKKINNLVGNISTFLGGITLIVIAILFLV